MRGGVRPSHFRSLFKVADNSLSVLAIASTDLWSVPPEWPAAAVLTLMTERGYDVATFEQRPPDRFVKRQSLSGRSGAADEFGESLDASLIVTSTLSLTEAMRELRTREFLFVLDGRRVVAVVTRADIQRPAVSMVVFEFILIIESSLARLIEAHLATVWREMLSPERLLAAEVRLLDRRHRNAELTLEDCLTFEDRIALVRESSSLRSQLGYSGKGQFDRDTGRLKRLRDTLAHAGNILDFQPDPEEALQFAEEVRALAERALTLVEVAEETE